MAGEGEVSPEREEYLRKMTEAQKAVKGEKGGMEFRTSLLDESYFVDGVEFFSDQKPELVAEVAAIHTNDELVAAIAKHGYDADAIRETLDKKKDERVEPESGERERVEEWLRTNIGINRRFPGGAAERQNEVYQRWLKGWQSGDEAEVNELIGFFGHWANRYADRLVTDLEDIDESNLPKEINRSPMERATGDALDFANFRSLLEESRNRLPKEE